MARFHFHKLKICFFLLILFSSLTVYYICFYGLRRTEEKRVLLESVKKHVNWRDRYYQLQVSANVACIHPSVDLQYLGVENLISTKDLLVCNENEDWVKVVGYEARISPQAIKKNGKISCTFTELIRVDDETTKQGSSFKTEDTFIFSHSDFYAVFCASQNGKRWESTLVGIRNDEALRLERGWHLLPDGATKFNVLILGFDSLSHNSVIRTLPKTYRYLTEELKANVLDGYNIVGDGTPQALIPILTGQTELELPETRRKMKEKAQNVDVYPFIWKDFKRNGYITLFAEDQPHEGIFNYRLKGFALQPTDHYMRPFFTYMYPSYRKHPNFCFYSTPRHKVFLKYVTDFFDVYEDKPRFAFAMHAELSHNDHNLIGIADDDIMESLSYLQRRGHLNETILILFSDHGNRFSAARSTQQGKQEERLPFFSVYLPPKFRELYPSAADNVRVNTHRLTSPFDVYPTLKDLTKFSGAKLGKLTERGISLFSEIPPSRTCRDAFIEFHWCACLSWEPQPTTNDKVVEASNALVHYINSFTAPQRSVCHEMKLLRISWAAILLPNEGLVNFKRTVDYDGFIPDFSDQTRITLEIYQVHIFATPSKEYFHTSNDFPMFEASLTYNIKQDTFSVKIDDISRINKYGDQPHCIMKSHPHLRKFCYCLEPP